VRSQRGVEGGYWLARPASQITLAEVIRAVEGPLANVRGARPESIEYAGSAEPLREVWVAVRASLRSVLEEVTLADVAQGELPSAVRELVADPEAWAPHP
jgi:Rrf2 family protein